MSRFIAVFAIVVFSFVAPSRAQDSPICPAGNLLAKRAPVQWVEIKRDMAMLPDEIVVSRGHGLDHSK